MTVSTLPRIAAKSARLKPRPSDRKWYGFCEDCGWDTRRSMDTKPTAGCISAIALQHGGVEPLQSGAVLCPDAIGCS